MTFSMHNNNGMDQDMGLLIYLSLPGNMLVSFLQVPERAVLACFLVSAAKKPPKSWSVPHSS